MSVGGRLVTAREARGLSRADVARATRIAEAHIAAIEEDRLEDLPAGPYRTAWVHMVADHLGVEIALPPPEEAPSRVPLNVVRAVALSGVFLLLGIVVFLQWGPRATTTPVEPGPPALDQRVEIEARESVRVAVKVDGEPVFTGVMAGGQRSEFEAHDSIEIEVARVDRIKLRYNGERVVPQGRQDAPRTLVFVDDLER